MPKDWLAEAEARAVPKMGAYEPFSGTTEAEFWASPEMQPPAQTKLGSVGRAIGGVAQGAIDRAQGYYRSLKGLLSPGEDTPSPPARSLRESLIHAAKASAGPLISEGPRKVAEQLPVVGPLVEDLPKGRVAHGVGGALTDLAGGSLLRSLGKMRGATLTEEGSAAAHPVSEPYGPRPLGSTPYPTTPKRPALGGFPDTPQGQADKLVTARVYPPARPAPAAPPPAPPQDALSATEFREPVRPDEATMRPMTAPPPELLGKNGYAGPPVKGAQTSAMVPKDRELPTVGNAHMNRVAEQTPGVPAGSASESGYGGGAITKALPQEPITQPPQTAPKPSAQSPAPPTSTKPEILNSQAEIVESAKQTRPFGLNPRQLNAIKQQLDSAYERGDTVMAERLERRLAGGALDRMSLQNLNELEPQMEKRGYYLDSESGGAKLSTLLKGGAVVGGGAIGAARDPQNPVRGAVKGGLVGYLTGKGVELAAGGTASQKLLTPDFQVPEVVKIMRPAYQQYLREAAKATPEAQAVAQTGGAGAGQTLRQEIVGPAAKAARKLADQYTDPQQRDYAHTFIRVLEQGAPQSKGERAILSGMYNQFLGYNPLTGLKIAIHAPIPAFAEPGVNPPRMYANELKYILSPSTRREMASQNLLLDKSMAREGQEGISRLPDQGIFARIGHNISRGGTYPEFKRVALKEGLTPEAAAARAKEQMERTQGVYDLSGSNPYMAQSATQRLAVRPFAKPAQILAGQVKKAVQEGRVGGLAKLAAGGAGVAAADYATGGDPTHVLTGGFQTLRRLLTSRDPTDAIPVLSALKRADPFSPTGDPTSTLIGAGPYKLGQALGLFADPQAEKAQKAAEGEWIGLSKGQKVHIPPGTPPDEKWRLIMEAQERAVARQ